MVIHAGNNPKKASSLIGDFFLKAYNVKMASRKLLIRLISLVFFIFLLNYLAMTFYWYSSVWYLDMLMHFLGGFWVALASIYLFPPKNSSLESILKIFFVVLMVGVGWEMFEILVDWFITGNSFNFLDTASDLFFDLSGGLCAVLYSLKKIVFVGESRSETLEKTKSGV